MKTKEPITFDFRSNSLTLFRILAALEVMTGHTVRHLGLTLPAPLAFIQNVFQGVPMFFGLAGYLIWESLRRKSEPKLYIKRRFWRIYPELWIAVLLNTVLIAVLYASVNWAELAVFTVTQGTILQFWTPESLRGYGVGTPNGSLGTICTLIQFYIVVWFFDRLFKKRTPVRCGVFFAASLALGFAATTAYNALTDASMIAKLLNQTLLPYFFIFAIGIVINEYKEKIIPFCMRFWPVFLAAHVGIRIICPSIPGFSYNPLACCLMMLWVLGFAYRFPKIKLPDYSYGFYIYHMIVVNLFVHFGVTKNIWLLPAVVGITVVMSAASARLVEFLRGLAEKRECSAGA